MVRLVVVGSAVVAIVVPVSIPGTYHRRLRQQVASLEPMPELRRVACETTVL
jgi:hypothetical protein